MPHPPELFDVQMAEAAEKMRAELADIDFHDPTTTLLANADGHLITTADAARAELVEHLTAGVEDRKSTRLNSSH